MNDDTPNVYLIDVDDGTLLFPTPEAKLAKFRQVAEDSRQRANEYRDRGDEYGELRNRRVEALALRMVLRLVEEAR